MIKIVIEYETDGMDGKKDHEGIAATITRTFPGVARPFVLLKKYVVTLVPPKQVKKKRR